MRDNILRIAILALLTIALFALAGASAEEVFTSEEGFTWVWAETDSSEPCAKIVGYDREAEGDMIVPEYLTTDEGSVYVNSIGDYAFEGCAFSYAEIGPNIWFPGEGMFMNCDNLTEIYYDCDDFDIPARTFKGCDNLHFVEFPGFVDNIGDEAFMDCISLEFIDLFSSSFDGSTAVPDVGTSAFEGCTSLTEVYFTNSWDDINSRAFANCENLSGVYFDRVDVNAIDYIRDYAFTGCTALEELLLPESNGGFSQYAFSGCDNLTLRVFSDSYALSCAEAYGVPYETVDIVDEETGLIYMVDYNAVTILGGTEDVAGDLVIPERIGGYYVDQIAPSAFASHENLTSVTVPDSVCYIGNYAFCYTGITVANMPDWLEWGPIGLFMGCENLVTVNGLTELDEIEDSMFYDCSSLESFDIPPYAIYIGYDAFSGCTSLETLTLPVTLREIGYEAFAYCDNLTLRVAHNTVGHQFAEENEIPYEFYDTFDEETGLFYVGEELLTIVGCTENVSGALVIPEEIDSKTVEAIATGAFRNDTAITSVVLPESVTNIYDYAFAGSAIESIVLPEWLDSLGFGTFSDCANLHTVSGLQSIIDILPDTFRNCSKLVNFELPTELDGIYGEAFYGCSSLESLTLPAMMIYVDPLAFEGCDNLTLKVYSGTEGYYFAVQNDFPYELLDASTDDGLIYAIIDGEAVITSYNEDLPADVVIPDELGGCMVTTINNNAFEYAPIDSVTVSENVGSIGHEAFTGSTLKKAVLPESVNDMSGRAFADCENLTEINFPDGIGFVAYELFSGCTSLKEIAISDGVVDIYTGAFAGCTALEKLWLPDTIDYIVEDAFDGCDNLTMYVYENSLPHEFAQDNGIPFVLREAAALTQIYGMPELTYLPVGLSFEPSLKFSPANAEVDDLTFITSDYNVVSVNDGVLTTEGEGTAKITVTGGGKKFMFYIEVGNYPTVKLPANVTNVDEEAFIGCENIVIADMRGNNEIHIGKNAFVNTPALTTVLLPDMAYIYSSSFEVNGDILFLTPNAEEVEFYKSYGYSSALLN